MDNNFFILDNSFNTLYVIERYESLIWTSRGRTYGDFELYLPVEDDSMSKFVDGYYILSSQFYDDTLNTAHLMIIEDVEIKYDSDKGTSIVVVGRSLKSILDRRIIWSQTQIQKNTNVQDAISMLVSQNLTSPTDAKRRITNFVFDSTVYNWTVITEDIQYEGENLYDAISDICEKYKINYSVVYSFNDNRFHMSLIPPVDRSYDQSSNPPVVFSSSLGNLSNSNYKRITSSYKNVACIHGEGDEYNMIKTDLHSDEYSGMDRREMFVNASDLQSELEDGTIYSTETYTNMLKQRGETELLDHQVKKTYEAETDNGRPYEYLKDYNIGDIVEIINEYGVDDKVFVSEMILSINSSGRTLVPTFEAIKGD